MKNATATFVLTENDISGMGASLTTAGEGKTKHNNPSNRKLANMDTKLGWKFEWN